GCRLRSLFIQITHRTGTGCSQRRRPPGPANLVGRFEPSRPVVQRQRLCRPQLSELWHADGLPAERADVRRCPRVRSDERFLRLLAHRLAGINLRRRQYRKLQTYDVIEIPPPPRPIPGGGTLAVRRLRAEQRLPW